MNSFDTLRTKIKQQAEDKPEPQDRVKLGRCELCNKDQVRLIYHYWDDNHINEGMWLCPKCHRFAESVDRHESLINSYLSAKRRIPAQIIEYPPINTKDSETPLCDMLLSMILVGGGNNGRTVE